VATIDKTIPGNAANLPLAAPPSSVPAIIKAMSDVTRLLQAIDRGDSQASAELLPLVYDELRRLARSHMANERAEHTLQATALVHEAYLRLRGDDAPRWDGRGHFFAAAAEAMRRILIEHARAKNAAKRGGHHQRIDLDDAPPPIACPCENLDELLALDEALDRLAQADAAKAELVKLLYFAGLNLEEAAAAQGISRTTAYRHWQFARAWLHDAMCDPLAPQENPSRGAR
jgi:RNA polymerase sigma factor (TIGR02999 family)